MPPGPWHGPRSSQDEEALTDSFMRAFVRSGSTTVRDTGGPDLDRTFRLFKSGRAGWPRFLGSGPDLDGLPGGPWPGLRTLDGVDDARQAVRELAAGGADFVKLYAWIGLDLVEAVVDEAHRPQAQGRRPCRASGHGVGRRQLEWMPWSKSGSGANSCRRNDFPTSPPSGHAGMTRSHRSQRGASSTSIRGWWARSSIGSYSGE